MTREGHEPAPESGRRLEKDAVDASGRPSTAGLQPHDADEDDQWCGEETIAPLNEALLAKDVAANVPKADEVRADTTVVGGNVAFPADSGLMAKGVAPCPPGLSSAAGKRTTGAPNELGERNRGHGALPWKRAQPPPTTTGLKDAHFFRSELLGLGQLVYVGMLLGS